MGRAGKLKKQKLTRAVTSKVAGAVRCSEHSFAADPLRPTESQGEPYTKTDF